MNYRRLETVRRPRSIANWINFYEKNIKLLMEVNDVPHNILEHYIHANEMKIWKLYKELRGE